MELTHTQALDEHQNTSRWSRHVGAALRVLMVFIIYCLMANLICDPIHPQGRRPRDDLPTAERPAQEGAPRRALLTAGKVRQVASSLRRLAAAAGLAIASRSRQAYLGVRVCLPRISLTPLRRRRHANTDSAYDLPIMRVQAWQRLAEPHASGESSGVGKEHGAEDDVKEGESKADAREPGGGGGGGVVDIQKPRQAVVVGMAV